MFLLNLGLKLTILGGAELRLLVNNLGTSAESDQAQINTSFHRLRESVLFFIINIFLITKKKLNLENSLEERDFK